MVAPLTADDYVIGTLNLYQNRPHAFDSDAQRVLQMIAQQAGRALRKAIEFDRTLESSLTDALTGLHNARYLNQFLDREVERATFRRAAAQRSRARSGQLQARQRSLRSSLGQRGPAQHGAAFSGRPAQRRPGRAVCGRRVRDRASRIRADRKRARSSIKSAPRFASTTRVPRLPRKNFPLRIEVSVGIATYPRRRTGGERADHPPPTARCSATRSSARAG